MTPQEFVTKWSKIQQKETAVSHSHFFDVCKLIDHPRPTDYDGTGKTFSFETQTEKPDGRKGYADVFFKDHFIWEYKGPHKNLDKAYRQLQLYREDLQNPPLLITSDIHNIIIHTNFNNYPIKKHVISFAEIMSGDGVEMLRWAFFDPDKFKPEQTQQEITKASADTFVAVADAMKKHQEMTGEVYTTEQLAHFMARLLFTLFAEDMELLPAHIFTQILQANDHPRGEVQGALRDLFQKMRDGGNLIYRIRHFNGTLFDDDFVPTLPLDVVQALLVAADQDWTAVDPSIFGTLFERVIDEGKRAQLGAHYTSVDDIMLIVEPVLMQPLRGRWDEVRRQASRVQKKDAAAAHTLLVDFAAEIAAVRVLDPACGSGNFLYVALRQLLDLQKKVIAYAERQNLPPIGLTVSPEQLYGIEINIYAHELAQITAWIGYLQWRNENGFGEMDDPVLRPLHNIKNMDAILAYDADGNPTEPEWPTADVIIGNPPFLGGRKMGQAFGAEYVESLKSVYDQRIHGIPDLVAYWFERARTELEFNSDTRIGLLATQSIRKGTNRIVLDRIMHIGSIFMAWSDKKWILEGASVNISIIGFDSGRQKLKTLDGIVVDRINADLTNTVDVGKAYQLKENTNLSFQGVVLRGKFNLSATEAQRMCDEKNEIPNIINSDVIRSRYNAIDITGRPQNGFAIDFGVNCPLEKAEKYKIPFAYLKKHVYPMRQKTKQKMSREKWWLYWNARPQMRLALSKIEKHIATPRVSKHRLFVFMDNVAIPDTRIVVIARQDDYFLGVLHSCVHEVWSLATSSRHGVGNDPTYNNTTCFKTYPFPWSPGQEPAEADDERVASIAEWARELVEWRQAWLNPPRNGVNGGNGGIDTAYEKMLKKRTLTNLYNGLVYYRQSRQSNQPFDQAAFDKTTRKAVTRAEIEELDDIHVGLDYAVLDAYGWPHSLTDEQILERLLALNLERAGGVT